MRSMVETAGLLVMCLVAMCALRFTKAWAAGRGLELHD